VIATSQWRVCLLAILSRGIVAWFARLEPQQLWQHWLGEP